MSARPLDAFDQVTQSPDEAAPPRRALDDPAVLARAAAIFRAARARRLRRLAEQPAASGA